MNIQHARGPLRSSWRTIAALFCLALAVHAIQFPPAGSIAGQWPLDTVVGTTTADVSGGNNIATLVAAPTVVAGLAGSAVLFNGSSQYLTVASSASLDVASGSFSAAAWVKPTTTAVGRIVNKWDGTKGWLMDVNTGSGGAAAAGFIRAKMSDGTTIIDHFVSGPIGTGAWQHIAFTADRTLNQLKLFVNGAQVGTTLSLTTMTGSLTNTALLGMGTIPSAPGNYYNGVLDEVIVYKRVLTGPELVSLATMPPPIPGTLTGVNGVGQVALSWGASAGAASYTVLRSGTPGGPYADPYVPIASGLAGLTYTDTTAINPNTFYYVVVAVAGATPSPYTNEVVGNPLPSPVTALPNTGLQTNENLATTTFNVKFNAAAPASNSVVTVQSNDTSEGSVSTTYPGATPVGTGFQITVTSGQTPTIPVLVTGVNDNILDGNVAYTISVTATNMGVTIPNVNVTNNDNDTPGITFSRTSGLLTTESMGTDSFTVSLNTQPYGSITMSLTSNLTTEGTVSPPSITFDSTNWNSAQQITLTGVDDPAIDFNIPYTILTGALVAPNLNDAAYNGLKPADISALNLDNEAIPAAPKAWGGCGLLGLEALLALALAAWRRKRTG